MPPLDPEVAGSGATRAQVVRDRPVGNKGIFLQKVAHQVQRGALGSLGLDRHIEDFAFGVDSALEIDHSTVDIQISFVQIPDCELVHPAAHRRIGQRDPALRQQILDIAKTRREPKIKPDRLLDDLRWETISGIFGFSRLPALLCRGVDGTAERAVTMSAQDMPGSILADMHRFDHAPGAVPIIADLQGRARLAMGRPRRQSRSTRWLRLGNRGSIVAYSG